MDTVGVGDGWTVDPLCGTVADGRVYGRGAADMKSGLAVALNLVAALANGPAPPDCSRERDAASPSGARKSRCS